MELPRDHPRWKRRFAVARMSDWVLATALVGECECIVTGDKDLLSLGEYRGVRILAPGEFWKYEASGRNPA